jgi:hypothetical protein
MIDEAASGDARATGHAVKTSTGCAWAELDEGGVTLSTFSFSNARFDGGFDPPLPLSPSRYLKDSRPLFPLRASFRQKMGTDLFSEAPYAHK